MLGVFIGQVRIGSLLKFAHLKMPWIAYSYGDVHEEFKTKKAAIAWLKKRHEAKVAA